MSQIRQTGRLVCWQEQRGFGFLQPTDGGEQLFIHVKELTPKHRLPQPGELFSYELIRDSSGRLRARNARLLGDEVPQQAAPLSPLTAARQPRHPGTWLVWLFFSLLLLLVALEQLPDVFLVGYALLSLLSYWLYSLDKRAAQNGTWRISEARLQWLALLGGWPGALLAQQRFRHKSSKLSFRRIFYCCVLLNLGLLWLLWRQLQLHSLWL